MKLIVGLGNPGRDYAFTRHNIGFMVVEELASRFKAKFRNSRRFKALTAEGVAAGKKCYLAKPQTFMNLSGHSVCSIVNWLKIELSDILLVMDDIALPFSEIRIRPKGSDGGHKGLRSAIDCLGTREFPRMRIGIMGRKNTTNCSGYVLERFTRKEEKLLKDVLERSSSACECWMRKGIGAAMNQYNSKIKDGG